MILNKAHDFGFVHIPKCAGSTIRHQLRDKDDLGGKYYHTMTPPGLHKINGNHVTLNVLARYMPEDYAALQAVTSYAIIRDPMDRFLSGIAQYIRRNIAEPAEFSQTQILDHCMDIIARVKEDKDQQDIYNTIFFRQVDYVYLDGEQIIDHVYAMENIEAFFDVMESRHGLTLAREQVWNPTVTYRVPQVSGVLKRLKGTAQKYLPVQSYASLRDLGVRVFTTKGVPKLNEVLLASDEVTSFVASHYAADTALYHKAKQQQDST